MAFYSGILPLSITGLDPLRSSGNVDLFLWATTESGVFDSVPLFIGTPEDRPIPEYSLNLYLEGPIGEANATLPLVVGNDNKPTATIDLFVKNEYTLVNSGISLFIGRPENSDGSQTINNLDFGTFPLFIAREFEGVSHRLNLFLKTPEQATKTMDLYIFGASGIFDSVDLYISGQEIVDGNIKLFVHGF